RRNNIPERNDPQVLAVLGMIANNPHISTREIGRQLRWQYRQHRSKNHRSTLWQCCERVKTSLMLSSFPTAAAAAVEVRQLQHKMAEKMEELILIDAESNTEYKLSVSVEDAKDISTQTCIAA
ncbi:hypothetical protein ALC57_05218, partial [Trachymyrmex cornetzi]